MSCLGVHFAITAAEAEMLRGFEEEGERLAYVQETLEELYFEKYPEFLAESDKAWDAMHRVLSDGELNTDGGKYPMNHVVYGGESLYDDEDYLMSLKTREVVSDIARKIGRVGKDVFRDRYFALDAESYGFPLSGEDFEYTWEHFEGVRALYLKAEEAKRFVLFTADQ